MKKSIIANIFTLIFLPQICFATTLWDPAAIKVHPQHTAQNVEQVAALINDGENLFSTRFNAIDGAGRPNATGEGKPSRRSPVIDSAVHRIAGPDANSCAGCHNQPLIGGAGDFVANVFVGAQATDPPSNRISPNLASERNTSTLFGSGAIELLAREITADLIKIRDTHVTKAKQRGKATTAALFSKGISFGRITANADGSLNTSEVEGIDHDLLLKPFGSKGTIVSLRDFTVSALNQHHGIQAEERFGELQTGSKDFDGDGVLNEFSEGQVTALVLFQASLPAPAATPTNTTETKKGKGVFSELGCAQCHRPSLPLASNLFTEPGPYNAKGTASIHDLGSSISIALSAENKGSSLRKNADSFTLAAYTDLKRHRICDEEVSHLCNEQINQGGVAVEQFLTTRLWHLATSAPYCHRGDCSTLSEAIMHHGGEARESRDRFMRLADERKKALIAFLLTLGAAEND